jgi:hypothetical protein
MGRLQDHFTPVAALTLLTCLLATRGLCASDSAALRRTDQRLDQPVTVRAQRIYVGDVLDRLSRQAGVALSASLEGEAGDVQIAVFLTHVPLADVMDGLCGLLSYRRAGWLWARFGKPGRYRYRLEQPAAARQLAARLCQESQATLEGEAHDLLAALTMAPDELQQAARQNPRVADLMEDPRMRAGLAVFAETLPPDTQLAVLRGQQQIRVPVAQLSPRGRAFVQSVWASAGHPMRKDNDGPLEPIPEPSWINFDVERFPGTTTPALFIHMEGIGGYGYLGGVPVERAWQQKMANAWKLPGDAADNPISVRSVPQQPEKTTRATQRLLALRLKQLADAVPVSLIARLPRRQNDPGPPSGQTVHSFLEHLLEALPPLQSKWRDNILLLTYPGWFRDEAEDSRVPWAVVKQLRQAEDASGGFLSARALAAAADQLRQPQLQRLAQEEFPVMAHVARWRDLFRLMHRIPQLTTRLLSPAGVPLADLPPALRTEIVGALGLEQALAATASLRVVETALSPTESPFRAVDFKAQGGKPFTRSIRIEAVGPNKQVIARQEFFYGGRNPE